MRSGICLYNSSGQPNIPLRHPEIFPQYASEGRITKSAEDPPIFTPGGTRKWGVVRIGLSLADARHEIHKTSRGLFLLGIVALVVSSGGASFLAMRISRPIQHLVTGVNAVAQGNYDHAIASISRDEVGHLAQRFEEMRQALRLHITHLAEEKQHLERANTTIKETQVQLIEGCA